jgi:hypothetical protein
MSKSRRTVPITYRNMPLKKSSYQRDLEMMEEDLTQRLAVTLLAIGLVFLLVMVVYG